MYLPHSQTSIQAILLLLIYHEFRHKPIPHAVEEEWRRLVWPACKPAGAGPMGQHRPTTLVNNPHQLLRTRTRRGNAVVGSANTPSAYPDTLTDPSSKRFVVPAPGGLPSDVDAAVDALFEGRVGVVQGLGCLRQRVGNWDSDGRDNPEKGEGDQSGELHLKAVLAGYVKVIRTREKSECRKRRWGRTFKI
ncbi:hypothetical protein EX30DRAFT_346479 [Ascodesmis nigricans]|uniref:Uncharacterized protein n=1 Tax=Ascodesmis nigricans TaxID=341454 RepID=A0A4V3SJE9_9PEZI|nr:hypothetical protein EX30DRAFT_346479 [Ascodesmis nigricans]